MFGRKKVVAILTGLGGKRGVGFNLVIFVGGYDTIGAYMMVPVCKEYGISKSPSVPAFCGAISS